MDHQAAETTMDRRASRGFWLAWLSGTCCLSCAAFLAMLGCAQWQVVVQALAPGGGFPPRIFGGLAMLFGALALGSYVGLAAWLVLARFVFGWDRARVRQAARGGFLGKADRWLIDCFYSSDLPEA